MVSYNHNHAGYVISAFRKNSNVAEVRNFFLINCVRVKFDSQEQVKNVLLTCCLLQKKISKWDWHLTMSMLNILSLTTGLFSLCCLATCLYSPVPELSPLCSIQGPWFKPFIGWGREIADISKAVIEHREICAYLLAISVRMGSSFFWPWNIGQ